MSISDKQQTRLLNYLQDKGHTIVDNTKTVKTEEWVIECGKCGEYNGIRVDSLIQIANTFNDIKCTNCKFLIKLNKFLQKNKFCLEPNTPADTSGCYLSCCECKLPYHYTGNYQDSFKCYCKLSIKQVEHKFYKMLYSIFKDNRPCLSKEVAIFNDHKIDIHVELDGKLFLFEIDDPGHFNNRTPQGLRDASFIEEFLEADLADTYLIHIREHDVYSKSAMKTLFTWIQDRLDGIPANNLLFVDFSGKNCYNHLSLENMSDYMLKK